MQLATIQANAFAGTAIDITADGVGSGHTLTRMHKIESLKHDQSGAVVFVGASTSSPDDQTIRLPGAGTYLVHVEAKRDRSNEHLARALFLIWYNNSGTNDLLATETLGTVQFIGNTTLPGLAIHSGPNAQGDVTFRFTYTAGPFTNRWIITRTRLDRIN